ncbi:MAG TPA: hypothetical protein IAA29_11390 [Candidatus Paenibacillus intestinavium]|nr:hypothetical protein [Candidatus Paenibacillus intestinavium]
MINKPLAQTYISERIWNLYHSDQEAFKREVNNYLALGYKGFTPVKVNYEKRIIWLRDDR